MIRTDFKDHCVIIQWLPCFLVMIGGSYNNKTMFGNIIVNCESKISEKKLSNKENELTLVQYLLGSFCRLSSIS